MKFLIGLSLVFSSLSAFSAEDLNSMKLKANSHIDSKMASLQSAKACINNASSADKFKACKYDMHEDMKAKKMQMMEEKREELSED